MSGPKFIHVPFEYEADEISTASRHGRDLVKQRWDEIAAAMAEAHAHDSERQEHQILFGKQEQPEGLTGLFTPPEPPGSILLDAIAMTEAIRGGTVIGDRRRLTKLPGDGEPAYLMHMAPDPVRMTMPMSWDMPKPDPIEFIGGGQLGGMVRPDPRRHLLTIVEPPNHERAMLEDGWHLRRASWSRCRAWLAPVGPVVLEDEWRRSDGGRISARRVASGRYADRLPTNRKRKRERAKERRRARMADR